MNTILSFMDKLYSDSSTLKIVYVVGAVLLFIFIVMLIISLRKPEKQEETKIIDEPKIDDTPKVEEPKEPEIIEEEVKEETTPLEEQSIFEKTRIIPLDELRRAEELADMEEVVEETDAPEEEIKEENITSLSNEIPDIDSFVDSAVQKTYEKNEQFSSVYVEKNEEPKLDKIMENLNVDKEVKEEIVPVEEKTIEETPKENSSLDALKQALEEKKKEVELKQEDLKMKLQGLKTTTVDKEDK